LCSYSRTSQNFMEPEGSLPCSQEPSTGPYPELDRSSPYHSTYVRSILTLSTQPCLGLPSGVFLLAFPPISYMHFSSPHSCYMPCSFHPTWVDYSNYIWRRVQVMKLLIMQFSPIPRHFGPRRGHHSCVACLWPLPSNDRCLQSHYLETALHVTMLSGTPKLMSTAHALQETDVGCQTVGLLSPLNFPSLQVLRS
jgi:hypothetical protein